MTKEAEEIIFDVRIKQSMPKKEFNDMAYLLGGEDKLLQLMSRQWHHQLSEEDNDEFEIVFATAFKGEDGGDVI